MANPYAPPGESEFELNTERFILVGVILNGFLYGIQFMLFTMSFRLLFTQLRNKTNETRFFLIYICSMFILSTLYLVGSARFAQFTFIDDRNFPGGPSAYYVENFSTPIGFLGSICYAMENWFADGLLIWRCTVIWKGSPFRPILLLPMMMYVTSFVLSIFVLIQIGSPTLSLWSSLQLSLPYFCVSLATNIVSSTLIVLRLLIQRRRILRVMGEHYASSYISIASMIVESAALYSAFSIAFLVPYVRNDAIQDLFLPMLSQVQTIAPLLIIYRVARGRAWSSQTNTMLQRTMDMRFAGPSELRTTTAGPDSTLEDGRRDLDVFPLTSKQSQSGFLNSQSQTHSAGFGSQTTKRGSFPASGEEMELHERDTPVEERVGRRSVNYSGATRVETEVLEKDGEL